MHPFSYHLSQIHSFLFISSFRRAFNPIHLFFPTSIHSNTSLLSGVHSILFISPFPYSSILIHISFHKSIHSYTSLFSLTFLHPAIFICPFTNKSFVNISPFPPSFLSFIYLYYFLLSWINSIYIFFPKGISSFQVFPLCALVKPHFFYFLFILKFEWEDHGTDILSSVKHNCRNIFRCTIYNIFSLKEYMTNKITVKLI